MADINAFLNAHKRVLDSLPRLQDEAIDSKDYTKVDLANETLDRIEKIGAKILGEQGVAAPEGPSGPIGAPGLLGQAGIPQDEMQSTEFLPEGGPTPVAPSLLAQPPVVQQPVAPVTINVAPQQQEGPSLLQRPSQAKEYEAWAAKQREPEIDPMKAQAKASMEKINVANNAIKALQKAHDAEAARLAGQAASAGGMAIPFNPHSTNDQRLLDYANRGEWDKIASDLRARSASTVKQPSGLDSLFGAKPSTIPGDPEILKILPIIEEAAKANEFLNEQRKSGGVLGLTREEVMPRQPKLLAEKRDIENQIRKSGELELPSLLTKKAEIEKNLENVAAFDRANPLPSVIEPPAPGLLQGEPGEAEAKAGTPVVEPVAVPETPIDYELQREGIETPTLDIPTPDANTIKKVYDNPKAALRDAEAVVKEHAPDYLGEFHKRVMTELGEAPKPNFLTVIGTILGGLAGNSTALKIWTDRVNSYNQAKQRIGSEIYSAGKQAAMIASQEKRQSARDEASHTRAMERDKAAGDRLEKQLGFGREKLTESARVNNIKLNLQKRQQDINTLYSQARTATAQQKAALMPLHDELNALTRKSNDLAKMASSFAMPQDQYAAQAAAVDVQIQSVLGRMAQVMGSSPKAEGE